MTAAATMPARIGRFRLRSMLGRGAMGVVYLGHDEEIDRLVAIKLIRADLLDTEERDSYLKRFRNEAKIAGRCVHANIVGLYDFAVHEDNPYLVMEYVNGVGLQQFYPRGSKRPVAEAIPIALQVLDALHYAHNRSIVHRDIKPANILMTPDASLKITDFGISRLTSMEMTATPLLIGTPSYMSPEQCIGAPLDGRNDLFSLGCVLYELVAGERAFAGVNYTETIFAIVNKPHVPLRRLVDDLPAGFSDAIDRALAKKPEDRFEDAAAFARTLDEIGRQASLTRGSLPAVIIDGAAPGRAATASAAAFVPAFHGDANAGPTSEAAAADDDDAVPGTIVVPLEDLPRAKAEAPPGAAGLQPPIPPTPAASPPPGANAAPSAGAGHAAPPVHATDVAPPSPAVEAVSPPTMETPSIVALTGTVPAADRDADEDATLIRPFVARPPAAAEAPPDRRSPPPEPAAPAFIRPAPPTPFPPAEPPLDDAERERIADCLAEVIGPIAPLLVGRAETPGMSAASLTAGLAGYVRHSGERQRFLALVGQPITGPADDRGALAPGARR